MCEKKKKKTYIVQWSCDGTKMFFFSLFYLLEGKKKLKNVLVVFSLKKI